MSGIFSWIKSFFSFREKPVAKDKLIVEPSYFEKTPVKKKRKKRKK